MHRPDPQDRPHAVSSRYSATSTSCRRLASEYFAQSCYVGVSQPGKEDAAARLRDRPRPFHVGERLPARRGHRAVHTRAPAAAVPRHGPGRAPAAARRQRGRIYGFDLDALAPLAAQAGPTVAEIATPLDKLPDNPNEALLKASRRAARTARHPSNGPLPIWSRTVTTGGLVRERRCQFAPSTTSVWPEMKRA